MKFITKRHKVNMASDILATDMIQALWNDARAETDPERKAQLERDATAFEDVWRRSKYALAPTRDQMTAALGNASLNISDTLSAVASGQRQLDDRVAEIHVHVQESNTLQSAVIEAVNGLRGDVQESAAEFRSRLGKIEEEHTQLAGFVSDLGEEQSQIRTDVGTLKTDFVRLETKVDALESDMGDVKTRVKKIEQIVQLIAKEGGAAQATKEMLEEWERNHPSPDLGVKRA